MASIGGATAYLARPVGDHTGRRRETLSGNIHTSPRKQSRESDANPQVEFLTRIHRSREVWIRLFQRSERVLNCRWANCRELCPVNPIGIVTARCNIAVDCPPRHSQNWGIEKAQLRGEEVTPTSYRAMKRVSYLHVQCFLLPVVLAAKKQALECFSLSQR